jgi:flagellin FlaB
MMIVLISMILVAGIAASVIIQTSGTLEVQAMHTGQNTRDEVSTGIRVYNIIAHYNNRNVSGTYYERIHNMSIVVMARPGSDGVNLDGVVVTISNGSRKCLLAWNDRFASAPSGSGVFSTANVFDCNASEFGIICIEDADGSCTSTNPVINRGDKAIITVNLSACFKGLEFRADVRGMVILEDGSPGVFLFRTPSSCSKTVFELF